MKKAPSYTTVEAFVSGAVGDADLLAEMERQRKAREIVDSLVMARVALRLTQGDIARRLGVSVSTISRLEDSLDVDLKVGEILDYVKALGVEPAPMVHRPPRRTVSPRRTARTEPAMAMA